MNAGIWADHDPLHLSGYAPCRWPLGPHFGRPWAEVEDAPRQLADLDAGAARAAGQRCDGRAWPTSAAWLAPGVIAVEYGPADCGHVEPTAFVLALDAADLDAGGGLDGPGGDAP